MSVPDPIPDLLSVAQVAERWRTKFDTPADEKYVLGCYGRLSFCISNFEPLASGYVTYSRDDVIARVKAESSFKEAFEFIRDLTKFEIDLLRVRREDLLTFEATQCDPSNMPDPFSEKLAERIELVIQTKISNGRVKVIDMLDEMSRVLNSLPSAAMRIYELSKGGKLDDRHGWVDSLTQDDIAMINKIWAEAALPRFTFGLPSDDWDNYQIAFEQAANRPTWNLQVCCFLPNRRQQAIECLFKNLSCSDYLVAYSDSGELAKQIELTSNIDVRDASRWLESWGFRLRQDGASEHNQAIKSGRPMSRSAMFAVRIAKKTSLKKQMKSWLSYCVS